MLALLILLAACSEQSLDRSDDRVSVRIVRPEPLRWLATGSGYPLRAVGDLDGDGLDDLAHIKTSGAGTCVEVFRPAVDELIPLFPCMRVDVFGWYPRNFAATDIDGDGEQDLVVVTADGEIVTFPATAEAPAEHRIVTPVPNVMTPPLEVGDLDGDGIGDFVVGDAGDDTAGTNAGAVLVFRGNEGAAPTLLTTMTGLAGDALGTTVALADLNGDGRDDVVATAPGWDNGNVDEGGLFWWPSIEGGLDGRLRITSGGRKSARLGCSLATADFDDDGDDDVLVGGVEQYEASGLVRLHEGEPSGQVNGADWAEEGGGSIGWSVALPGDVDGDGFLDLLVGAPNLGVGAVFVYAGSAEGFPNEPTKVLRPRMGYIGSVLGGAGDVDGNGIDDVIVDDDVLFGYPGGLQNGAPDPDWTYDDPYRPARILIATDLDGDGIDDLLALRDPAGPGGGGVVFPGGIEAWKGRAQGLSSAPDLRATTTTIGSNRTIGLALVGAVAGMPGPNLLYWDPMLAGTGGVRIHRATGWTLPGGLPAAGFERTGPAGTTGYATGATVGDFDGDGSADLALADGTTTAIYAGTATGIADAPAWTLATPATRLLTLPDVDGDSCDELLLATATRLDVYLGDPAFPGTTAAYSNLVATVGLSVVDLDGDGVPELLLPQGNWYRHLTPGLFGPPAELASGPRHGATPGDFDQDGIPEMVAGATTPSGSGGIGIFRGHPWGPLDVPWWADEAGSDAWITYAVGDLDGNGSPDLISSHGYSPGEIRVYWSDVAPVPSDTGDTGGTDTGPVDTGDTGDTDTGADTDTAVDTDTDDTGSDDSDTDDDSDDGSIQGCPGCGGGPGSAPGLALLVALLAVRRRAAVA